MHSLPRRHPPHAGDTGATSPTAAARTDDIDKLEELANTIKATALCGLGQTAPNPVLSTLRYFRDEYEAHIYEKRCPAGHCKKLARIVIDPEKCRGCSLCAKNCPVECHKRT